MSHAVEGGINYALVKNHYDADDYIEVPFTATPRYYIVGLNAACTAIAGSDPTFLNYLIHPEQALERGWCFFTHGQATPPIWFGATYALWAAVLQGILQSTWPAAVPAFEAKDILFYSDQDCWVSFDGSARVRHFIPATTYKRYHTRCFMLWVVRHTADGTLQVDIEG